MNSKHSGIRRCVYVITFSILCLLVWSSSVGTAIGQKLPKSVPLDPNADEVKLCSESSISGSEFCSLFRSYYTNLNNNNDIAALENRNEMIEIVRGQIDSFYKQRKDGRSTKIRVSQTILDFLEIGGALAVTIMNGERAKTIVGAGIAALQGGRAKFDKNFQILQTQVLINKMNANRAEILTEILSNIDKPVRPKMGDDGQWIIKPSDTFSWKRAKNRMREYLLAGTFDNALDSLVEETGEEVAKAKKKLKNVETQSIAGGVTDDELSITTNARKALEDLGKALDGDSAKAKQRAGEVLQAIVEELSENDDLKTLFDEKDIDKDSGAADILKALIEMRGELLEDNEDLVDEIDKVIVKQNK